MDVQIEESWKKELQIEFDKPYFAQIVQFIKQEKAAGKTIFPKGEDMFAAFNTTPFNKIKVVVLGQDPYHGQGQAHGLCFSVQKDMIIPPSLKNIYKELAADIGFVPPDHGCLSAWAEQGVFMLNASLTVEQANPNSHSKIGWATFTDAVIKLISARRENIVFLLWGKFAQAKMLYIDHQKHHILTAAHPSPFSAYNGFYGCKHFSKTNDYLKSFGKEVINWQL